MIVLHVADLHLGKILQNKSLAEDQKDWTEKFVALVRKERPAAVVVAGDVYDRAAPSAEAVELFDRFLTDLLDADDRLSVMVVAGNHDSGPRLAFASSILEKQRLFLAGGTERRMKRVDLEDEHGPVSFWLMPYTFPSAVRQALGEDGNEDFPRTYTEAVRRYLGAQEGFDPARRNVLVAHQNVTHGGRNPERGGSETMIGGVGGVDVSAFDAFDYVALGHVHKAQAVGRDTARYAGSPLCYHFDEARWPDKGAVRVELGAKGNVGVRTLPIAPLHPLRVVEGAFGEIVARENANGRGGEYVKVVLTDRRVNPADADSLRALFAAKGSVALETVSAFSPFSAAGTRSGAARSADRTLEEKFADFWRDRHGGSDPDAATAALVRLAAGADGAGGPADATVDRLVRLAVGTEEG